MLEDDVELRVCADVALEVDPEGQRLDIFGDQPGGDARCARRFVKAGADGARDPERRVIDGDGDFLQPQFAAVSADRKPEVERRAEGGESSGRGTDLFGRRPRTMSRDRKSTRLNSSH